MEEHSPVNQAKIGAPLTRIELGEGVVSSFNNQKSASRVSIVRPRILGVQAASLGCKGFRFCFEKKRFRKRVVRTFIVNCIHLWPLPAS